MSGLEGDWDRLRNILNPQKLKEKMTAAGKRAGNFGASAVKKGIVSGAPGGQKFEPLQALTIRAKGSARPLIDRGDLVGSVTYALPGPDTVWIGVKKTAGGKDGKKPADIAAVHEFGCTVPVTDRMRRGFAARFRGTGIRRETKYIYIPPRPYLRPTIEDREFQDEIAKIYLEAIRKAFAG